MLRERIAPMMISVVVATLGRSSVFERCIVAIACGSRPADEIVVVDQSADGLAPVVERLLEGATTAFRHVRASALGISRARNLGAAAAAGDTLAFTDDDCVPDTDWLAALAGTDADAATGRVLPLHDERSGLVAVSSRTSTERRMFRGDTRELPWEVGSGGNLLLARDVFERSGGFDEHFGPGARYRAAEDVELLERLLASGAPIVYTPDAVVYHERKRRSERLARRLPYGFGMGAAVASVGGGRRRFLAMRYLGMQAHALAAGAKGVSLPQMAEPVLSTAGFVAGMALYRSSRFVPKDTVRTP
jgi:GT2 family glycosyltransferase